MPSTKLPAEMSLELPCCAATRSTSIEYLYFRPYSTAFHLFSPSYRDLRSYTIFLTIAFIRYRVALSYLLSSLTPYHHFIHRLCSSRFLDIFSVISSFAIYKLVSSSEILDHSIKYIYNTLCV